MIGWKGDACVELITANLFSLNEIQHCDVVGGEAVFRSLLV